MFLVPLKWFICLENQTKQAFPKNLQLVMVETQGTKRTRDVVHITGR